MIQKLRQEFPLAILLEIAQLPRATFYYHLKQMNKHDKYEDAKAEITAIYHENKGRYGYRRITIELHNRNFPLNHKTVQRLMKELRLVCCVRMKKYRSYKGEVGKIAPNLLNRDFHAEKPNQNLQEFLWITSNRSSLNISITTTTTVSRQSLRACRLLVTDNKPFRLLEQFLLRNIV